MIRRSFPDAACGVAPATPLQRLALASERAAKMAPAANSPCHITRAAYDAAQSALRFAQWEYNKSLRV